MEHLSDSTTGVIINFPENCASVKVGLAEDKLTIDR